MSVIIEQNVLEYHSPLTETSTNYIVLRNETEDVKAFKIKTTAPKLYCVRPNAAIIQPGETVKVSIIFLGLTEEPVDYKCKDKFLVIVLPAPYDIESGRTVSDIWNDLEAEFKAQSIQKKIKVVYNPTPLQVAQPQEYTKEEPVQKETTPVQEKQSEPQQIPERPVESTVEPTEEKKESYKKKPEEEPKPRKTTPVPAASLEPPLSSEQQELNSKISPSAMLFIAIIVLALGWLYY
ncbi:phosphatidylinositol-binding protein scs2 [Monosporozyma unispora]|nr:phosphatidylinositol-binding protein scs2 [Kazachstania unispora]